MLLLTFTAGANRYAVDVTRVVEIVPRVELRKVPHAPELLAGLLGYRGKVVPVIDLGLLLDVAPCRDCLSTRIILVDDQPDDTDRSEARRDESFKRNPKLLGLIAEHVSDLSYPRPEQIVAAPVWLPLAPYLGAVVQTDQGIIQLIAVEKVRAATLQFSDAGQVVASDTKLEL